VTLVGSGEVDCGAGLKCSGDEALGLGDKVAVLDVEAQRGIRLDGVSVLAGEGLELGAGGGGFCFLQGVQGRDGSAEKQWKTKGGESNAAENQGERPPKANATNHKNDDIGKGVIS